MERICFAIEFHAVGPCNDRQVQYPKGRARIPCGGFQPTELEGTNKNLTGWVEHP